MRILLCLIGLCFLACQENQIETYTIGSYKNETARYSFAESNTPVDTTLEQISFYVHELTFYQAAMYVMSAKMPAAIRISTFNHYEEVYRNAGEHLDELERLLDVTGLGNLAVTETLDDSEKHFLHEYESLTQQSRTRLLMAIHVHYANLPH